MKTECPHFLDVKSSELKSKAQSDDPEIKLIVGNGSFLRSSDSKHIKRFYCRKCGRYFSNATLNPTFGQKKRRINPALMKLLCSGVSQRRAARLLGINRKTVARKLRFLSQQARLKQREFLKQYEDHPLVSIQWDDLETSEHSKCKPLSVTLAVEPSERKILGFQVSQMPAKGHLAKIAIRKYGYRRDERAMGWNVLFKSLIPIVDPQATFTSDENPHYSKPLLRHFPNAKHVAVKGRRGCIAGQGELKKIGFDPLFSLNHTCAMLRANLNRLFRRTWCTTKNRQALNDHIALYVDYHNCVLTRQRSAA
jgi:hypothetical protein